MNDANARWAEEMKDLQRLNRQLTAERDAARGAVRLLMRAVGPLVALCRSLLERDEVPATARATLERLLREWDEAMGVARKGLP